MSFLEAKADPPVAPGLLDLTRLEHRLSIFSAETDFRPFPITDFGRYDVGT
jgi:hypothetical protein